MKRLRRTISGFTVAALLGLTGATAHAQEPVAGPPAGHATRAAAGLFGDQGQWVFSISNEKEFPFSFSKTGGGGWGLALRPSADYFLAPNVSVGGIVSLTRGGGDTNIGFGPRVGYDLIVSSLISIWFRGGVFFDDDSPPMGANTTTTDIGIQVPFLFHLVPHFFLGVGPFANFRIQQSAGGTKENTLGLTAIVGGYL
jgi:hypothetical protein